jgi:GR25 family glycosyltransferase involved in LPS biosynthesis
MEWVLIAVLWLVSLILVLGLYSKRVPPVTKAVLINLDSNTERLASTIQQYQASNLVQVPLERFRAVVGRTVDPRMYLTPEALEELREVETSGYRTKHHQLTRGGIGCFLSHMRVMAQMNPGDVYLVLEDDIVINPSAYTVIQQTLQKAPKGWDFLLLGYNSYVGQSVDATFMDVRSFWGTCGYIVTYKAAQTFLNEVGSKFDCQIDTLMSWMAAEGKLNIYALKVPIIRPSGGFETNIQSNIKVSGVDAYKYRDKILQLGF